MYDRFTRIDDLTRPDHSFLRAEDECYYLGEYTARGGYSASKTNELISNLKKPMNRRQSPEWAWKRRAIETAATEMRNVLGPNGFEHVTFVPTPPSKIKTSPDYDDRLVQILRRASAGQNADIREIVVQEADMAASHEGDRASIDGLMANYVLDQNLLQPIKGRVICIFDDMLTTGRHFRAMSAVLLEVFPGITTRGLFIARRAPRSLMPAEFSAIFS